MRVILFKPEHAPLIKAGDKWLTIRPRAMYVLGEQLSLRHWSGLPFAGFVIAWGEVQS